MDGRSNGVDAVKLGPSLAHHVIARPGPWLLLSHCFLDLPLEGHDVEQQPSPTHDQADEELLSQ